MRALAFPAFDSAPALHDLPLPEPAPGEVRVRVHAASVNGFDLAVAAGYVKDMMEHRFPVVLGKDFAGTIDALGDGVSDYAIGDRVFGVVTKAFVGDGSLGEFVAVPVATGLAALPDGIEFAEAAALGLAGATALGAIETAELKPGQSILVVGATGGVGNQAVQLAARAGAHVIATAHTDAERAHVTRLGAGEIVDHTGDIVAAVLAAHSGGVDVVLHLAGDPVPLLAAVAPGGRLLSTLIGSPDQLPSDTVTVLPIFGNPSNEILARLATAQNSGDTRVSIQQTYPLDDAPQALADFGAGTLGKLVVVLV